jgi:hypothetical protein
MDARATADPTTTTPPEPIPPPSDGVPEDDLLCLMLPTIRGLYRDEGARLRQLSEVMTAAVSGLIVAREKSNEFEETYTPLSAHESEVAGALRRVAKACGEQIEAIVGRSPILPIYTERTDL